MFYLQYLGVLKCSITDFFSYNESIDSTVIIYNTTKSCTKTTNMRSIEDKDPPRFGLITPGALSPCLFTLLQQLGHVGVNKASSSIRGLD